MILEGADFHGFAPPRYKDRIFQLQRELLRKIQTSSILWSLYQGGPWQVNCQHALRPRLNVRYREEKAQAGNRQHPQSEPQISRVMHS